MRRILKYAALLALTACATTSGKCVQYLECPGGMDDCRELAKETCPNGYHLLDNSDIGSDFSDFAKEHFEGARTGVPHINVTCD